MFVVTGATVFWLAVAPCRADTMLNPAFNVSLVNLGAVSLPVSNTTAYTYQGVGFNGQNLLLADWNPAQLSYPTSEVLWQVPTNRAGNGQITSLGPASAFATVETSNDFLYSINVSGGLSNGPGGVLFYSTTEGNIGEYLNGASMLIGLSDPADPAATVSALGFLPIGTSSQLVAVFAGSNNWYLVSLSAGSNGFYNASLGNLLFSGVEATSFVYAPAVPNSSFTTNGILVGDSATQSIQYFGLGPQGNLTTAGTWLLDTSGNGSIPGYGLARDPNTGNFILTANDNNLLTSQVWELDLGAPEPSTAAGVILCGVTLWWLARRRRARTEG